MLFVMCKYYIPKYSYTHDNNKRMHTKFHKLELVTEESLKFIAKHIFRMGLCELPRVNATHISYRNISTCLMLTLFQEKLWRDGRNFLKC